MDIPRASWRNTTHDWARTVDLDHLEHIRRNRAAFAPGGIAHLILEVVAYAADEAEADHGGRCRITLHPDGSVAVADNGRGTDTRLDEHGDMVKKPVMATKDLRFFDNPDAPLLPDGQPRRGMSVVAALSTWLIHTNRRLNGSWTQRYERGVPTTDLRPIADDRTSGTTVHFLPIEPVRTTGSAPFEGLARLIRSWRHLSIELDDRRGA
ncbi:ATP-binding protein [Streptomyces sp. NPDC052644]